METKNKNANFVYEITQEEFLNFPKERMISFFKTSREILKKSNFPEDDEKFNKKLCYRKKTVIIPQECKIVKEPKRNGK